MMGQPETHVAAGTAHRAEAGGLIALGAFTLFALFGYAVFALRPQNLAAVPFAAGFFGVSFRFFAQLHILISFAALAIVLTGRSGTRWIPTMLVACAVSFTAEHMGTGYGIPFGGYEYTSLLGMRIGPRVPALIPLSWFLMALPCWVIARASFPRSTPARIGLAALGLVLWDLALDPAMSSLTQYWVWHESGPYYGMPWLNLAGWFVTGLVLMSVIEGFSRSGVFDDLPTKWMFAYYLTVLSMPLGMLAAAGSWLGFVTTLAALGLTTGVVLSLRSILVGSSGAGSDSSTVPNPVGAA
jgi:putative membrane protein